MLAGRILGIVSLWIGVSSSRSAWKIWGTVVRMEWCNRLQQVWRTYYCSANWDAVSDFFSVVLKSYRQKNGRCHCRYLTLVSQVTQRLDMNILISLPNKYNVICKSAFHFYMLRCYMNVLHHIKLMTLIAYTWDRSGGSL